MKMLLSIATLLSTCAIGIAQNKANIVTTPNYDLAERFSAKKIGQMVHSTQIKPNWFANSDKFWYSWQNSTGTEYYIIDCNSGSKTAIFDLKKLAMELTTIVKDPYDAQHITFQKL